MGTVTIKRQAKTKALGNLNKGDSFKVEGFLGIVLDKLPDTMAVVILDGPSSPEHHTLPRTILVQDVDIVISER